MTAALHQSEMHPGTIALLRSHGRAPSFFVGQDQPWWDQPLLEFVGPDTARQRVLEVDGLFSVLDLDIARSTSVSPRFRDLWTKHYGTWKDFKKSVDAMSYVALLVQALSVNERAGHFARGLKDWRDAFTREGGAPASPTPAEQHPSSSPVLWPAIALVGAVGIGLFAAGFASRRRSSFAST